MTNVNATTARANFFQIANRVVKLNDVVNITTKDGNVVMLNEEEYNGMIETIYLMNSPETFNQIIEGKNAPKKDFVEIDWKKELE